MGVHKYHFVVILGKQSIKIKKNTSRPPDILFSIFLSTHVWECVWQCKYTPSRSTVSVLVCDMDKFIPFSLTLFYLMFTTSMVAQYITVQGHHSALASQETVRNTAIHTHISAKLVVLASWSFHLLSGFKVVLVTLKMVTILSHIHTPRPPWTFRQRTFLSGDYFCVLLHKVCSLYFGLAPALSHYQHSGYYDNLIISDSAASFLFCLPLSKFWSG